MSESQYLLAKYATNILTIKPIKYWNFQHTICTAH